MTRPLRLEFPGALYHVTARGDRCKAIFEDSVDRNAWLAIVSAVNRRHNVVLHAYCQMGNHYHLMIETPEGNLHRAMRQLNSSYSQYFNRRRHLVGHLFQGRYKAILVQKESYLLELARYIVLNPVRANIVTSAAEWCWSSYLATAGKITPPTWLVTDWLLDQFASSRIVATQEYEHFVAAGINGVCPLVQTKHQLVLGDESFTSEHANCLGTPNLNAVTRIQRRLLAPDLAGYAERHSDRDTAMADAYSSTVFTMTEIAAYFHVSAKTVERAVRRSEAEANLSTTSPKANGRP